MESLLCDITFCAVASPEEVDDGGRQSTQIQGRIGEVKSAVSRISSVSMWRKTKAAVWPGLSLRNPGKPGPFSKDRGDVGWLTVAECLEIKAE